MSDAGPSEEELDALGDAPNSDLAGDVNHDEESRKYLQHLNKRQDWSLLQTQISFWALMGFAVVAMIVMYCFTARVLADDGASLSDWGVAALIAGTIAQSAFLMRATVPGDQRPKD